MPVTPGNRPVNVPVPGDKPVKSVKITVTTSRGGVPQTTPTEVKVLIKGCLECM